MTERFSLPAFLIDFHSHDSAHEWDTGALFNQGGELVVPDLDLGMCCEEWLSVTMVWVMNGKTEHLSELPASEFKLDF